MSIFNNWLTGGRRETRSSYTDLLVENAIAAAQGTAATRLQAAVEAAGGLWERGLSTGVCERLTRRQLGIIGRSLLLRGEVVFPIEQGKVGALPAASWDVRGKGGDPGRWTYRITMASPSATRTVVKAGADVLHVRIGIQPSRPWAGVSPLANAEGTRAVLARLEQSMSDEAGTAVGFVIPVPEARMDDLELATDIRNLRGRAVLGGTTAGGWGEGRGAAPTRDWQAQRLGPRFTADEVQARTDVERSVLAAAGVPVDLVIPSSGGDAREAWRRFLHATLGPVAALIGEELARVNLSGSVDLSGLGASDLAGRARAYGQLRKAEMPDADARRICGF